MKVGILLNKLTYGHVYEAIGHYAKMGFDNGQLCVWDMQMHDEKTIDEVKRACKDFSFTITAVWCGWTGPVIWSYPECYVTLGLVPSAWRAQRVQELLNGAAFARAIGVKDIVTHIGYLPDNPYHPDNLGVVMALKQILAELKKYDQYFLFETGEELPLSLVHLMNSVGMDNWGINFDPANLILNGRGACPATALEFLAPHIRGFHAKDAKTPVPPECKKVQMKAGCGDSDFPRLVQILKKIGYQGSLTIEHERPSAENRDQEIMETKVYLENLIAEAN